MSKFSAVIAGLGPVNAIGCGQEGFWRGLVAGQHGFAPITLCDVSCSPSKIGAEVKDFQLDHYIANDNVLKRRLPRAAQLGLAAASLAVQDASLNAEAVNPDGISVCRNVPGQYSGLPTEQR